jgi:predicted RNA-binding Zn ribbon-like protein
VDFLAYAEASARLLNEDINDLDDLRDFLSHRAWLIPQCVERDVRVLRRFRSELRTVFELSQDDSPTVIRLLNDLMSRYPIRPRIEDGGPDGLHLHVAKTSSVSELLIGESLLGLAALVCTVGSNRIGVCAADTCTRVFVDASPNGSRRYCSERCSSRANVAAFRARRRQAAADA